MKDLRLLVLFTLGSADMLLGKVFDSWAVMGLGGFAAGAALASLLHDRLT